MSDDPVGLGDEMSEGKRDDLVQRLRVAPDYNGLHREAADRIEALEGIIAENVAQDGKPLLERMDELRTRIVGLEAMLVDGQKREQELERQLSKDPYVGVTLRKLRMERLEAALRDIAADRAFYVGDTYIEYQQIARRALEGKA